MATPITSGSVADHSALAKPGIKGRPRGEDPSLAVAPDPSAPERAPAGDRVAVSEQSLARTERQAGPTGEQRIPSFDAAMDAVRSMQAHLAAAPQRALSLQALRLPADISALLE